MVRNVLDIILAVYLLGWTVCLIWIYRRIHDPEFCQKISGNLEPADWPVWVWMLMAIVWPWFVWRFMSLNIRYRIGKAALKIADWTLNSLKKGEVHKNGGNSNEKTGCD